jgi:hypothetical protein
MNILKIYRNNLPVGSDRLSKDNAGVRFCHGEPESAELVQTILRFCKYRILWIKGRFEPGITDFVTCNMVMQQMSDCFFTGALPAGNRNTDGTFNNLGSNAYFWSSSENSSTNAWNRNLNSSNDGVNRNNNNKTNGYSVRCLKDLLPINFKVNFPVAYGRKVNPLG